MHAARLLARLRERPLPPRAQMSGAVSLLLEPQAGRDAGGMGEGGSRLPSAARAALARLAQGLGGPVAVLKFPLPERGRVRVGLRAVRSVLSRCAARAALVSR